MLITKLEKIFAKMSKILTSSVFAYNSTKQITGSAAAATKVKLSTKKQITFEIKNPFKLHLLNSGPALTSTMTAEQALHIYKQMAVIRRMEMATGQMYKEKLVRGFCHLYIGQEAVAVGMHTSMRPADSLITSYRCHSWMYLMGASFVSILAELAGRKSGCSRGKGGSMHMYIRNFYGGNGIVGAQVPLGAGVAFAHKYVGDGGVNFALYGDGAANQGQIFETMNIAKLMDLPVVFVCENNEYGMGTSAERSSASVEYYKQAGFVPGIWVDGMDVNACKEATRFAIDYCTSGKGPLIMEMQTYRYVGHSMSDPGTSYRTNDEVKQVRQSRDPIKTYKEKLLETELYKEEEFKAIDKKAREVVAAAVEASKRDSVIGLEEIAADIYKMCQDPDNIIRGVTPNKPLKHISVRQ